MPDRPALARRLMSYAAAYRLNAGHFPPGSTIRQNYAARAADCEAAAIALDPDLDRNMPLPALPAPLWASAPDPAPEDAAAARAAPTPSLPAVPPQVEGLLPTETLRHAVQAAETVIARRHDDAPALQGPVEILRETIAAREAEEGAAP